MTKPIKKVAVLCAGGPASGFNPVKHGIVLGLGDNVEVWGLNDGFLHLTRGEFNAIRLTKATTRENASRGGSIIGTSRAKPVSKGIDPKNCKTLATVKRVLEENGIDALITIGGDDTATSAMLTGLPVVHVPKTIDNDLPLPDGVNTFGYATAVAEAVRRVLVKLEDSRTTGDRHFIEVIMGRTAGHLALGTAKEVGCAAFIPEEFEAGVHPIGVLTDLVIGSILKAEARHIVAGGSIADRGAVHIVAEGVFEQFADFKDIVAQAFPLQPRDDLYDEHGHLRFSRIAIDTLLDHLIAARMGELGIASHIKSARHGRGLSVIIAKTGFELRCADPIEADGKYAQLLGRGAAEGIQGRHFGTMVYPGANGKIQHRKLSDLVDSGTGKIAVRHADPEGELFQGLLRYRLLPRDLGDGSDVLEVLKRLTGMEQSGLNEVFGSSARIAAQHASA